MMRRVRFNEACGARSGGMAGPKALLQSQADYCAAQGVEVSLDAHHLRACYCALGQVVCKATWGRAIRRREPSMDRHDAGNRAYYSSFTDFLKSHRSLLNLSHIAEWLRAEHACCSAT